MPVKHKSQKDVLFDSTVTVLTVLALLITFYPLYFVLIASISRPEAIFSGKVIFFPSGFDLTAYKFIFAEDRIWRGYINTISYTVFGTLYGTIITLLAGYALSRKDLIGRNLIMKLMVFTMFFQGGLIPTYVLVNSLGLINSYFVLIIVGTVWVFNIIIARTFFQSTLPDELLEAAVIDGCGNLRYFLFIAMPLSKSVIAVIALFYAIGQWNSYFNALIFTTDRKLYPLQLVLRDLLVQGQSLAGNTTDLHSRAERQKFAEVIKYATIIVSSLPIICVYPFIQKYFVKGIMIGSVKG